ncbi:MAG: two-component regulator propeller domain-containing protein [Saprospiraceae bacterium]
MKIFIPACYGQNSSLREQAGGGAPKKIAAVQAETRKAQGRLPHGNIYCGIRDKAGNLWFGTEEGAFRYDGQSMTNFTTKDGLIGNNVFSIVEDKAGNLWFGTRNMGLCRYDGQSFTNFTD